MGHKWMYQMVSAPLWRVRCIWGFKVSRDRFKEAHAGDRTPLQGSIFGLGLTSKCVVTRTVDLRAGFFLKRFYWSRQKKRDTFTVSVQCRDSSPAVLKTTGSLDKQLTLASSFQVRLGLELGCFRESRRGATRTCDLQVVPADLALQVHPAPPLGVIGSTEAGHVHHTLVVDIHIAGCRERGHRL